MCVCYNMCVRFNYVFMNELFLYLCVCVGICVLMCACMCLRECVLDECVYYINVCV